MQDNSKKQRHFPPFYLRSSFYENGELKNERGSCVFRADLFDENGRASITCKNNIFTYYDDIAFDERDEEGFYFKEIDFKDQSSFLEKLKSDGNITNCSERECNCYNCRGYDSDY